MVGVSTSAREECLRRLVREPWHRQVTGKKSGWDYYISGGDDERTLRENANVYQATIPPPLRQVLFLPPRPLLPPLLTPRQPLPLPVTPTR